MRRLATALALATMITACSGGGQLTPFQRLQDKLATVVEQANAEDKAALLNATADLRDEVEAQRRSGELPNGRATQLLRLIAAVEADADLLGRDEEPSPTPEVTRTSPPPSPTPPPTTAPPTTPPPTSPPPAESSPTPSQAVPPVLGGSPSASPAAT